MRRFFALLLAFALLIPTMVWASAAETESYLSYEENFDTYPDGKMSSHKMARPDAWGYGIVGGSSSIRNKALVLSGTVSYQNLVIPAQIIAGEAYAKEQTWQITVTIPEGLDEKSEIQLLRYEGKGTPTTGKGAPVNDGGIKIRQGVVYYSQLMDKHIPTEIRTEDQTLCKLNPGTYTFKRTLNMHDPETFTYSISLLDQSGKEIAKIKNVESPKFTAITSISFGTNKASQEVTFDDYKISASGVAANLFLYDAAGKELKNDDLHTADTAYRLAWYNATDKAKTYILMAGYYEGEKLVEKQVIREFTLAASEEGVETGTVEVAEGRSVKIYLRDPAQERAQLIKKILLIGVPVVVLAAIVTTVILVKKKKKNTPAEPQITEA